MTKPRASLRQQICIVSNSRVFCDDSCLVIAALSATHRLCWGAIWFILCMFVVGLRMPAYCIVTYYFHSTNNKHLPSYVINWADNWFNCNLLRWEFCLWVLIISLQPVINVLCLNYYLNEWHVADLCCRQLSQPSEAGTESQWFTYQDLFFLLWPEDAYLLYFLNRLSLLLPHKAPCVMKSRMNGLLKFSCLTFIWFELIECAPVYLLYCCIT